MTRFTIDGFDFDGQSGVIRTLETDTRVYTTPTSPYVGVQILPPRGPAFVLQLTRYCAARDLETVTRFLVGHKGRLVTIVDQTHQYIFLPWRLRFLVADVAIVSADIVPHVMTNRGSVRVSHSPGGVITSTWTLHAIPAG